MTDAELADVAREIVAPDQVEQQRKYALAMRAIIELSRPDKPEVRRRLPALKRRSD